MQFLAKALTVLLLTTAGCLSLSADAAEPIGASNESAAPEILSAKLREWNATFLEQEDEAGFWKAVQKASDAGEYPIVEESDSPDASGPDFAMITFLHQQVAEEISNVLLFANINHVEPSELLFERIGVSNVYFKSVVVPRSVRFLYRIIENDPLTGIFAGAKYGTRMHVLGGDPDPFNPRKRFFPGGLGEGRDFIRTWVELPGAAPQPYIVDKGNAQGTLETQELESTLLGYSRNVHTFLPPGYDPANEYPLMILFDAVDYFSMGFLQLTLENLIAEGSIPPLVVLGIDAGKIEGQTQRNDEFTCNPKFMEFLNSELLPWFTSQYHVSADPDQRIIVGSSFGGLLAAYFAFHHPETVSNVLSQSGSFHWGKKEDEFPFEWLVREFAFGEKKPITIYMEVGNLEGEYSWSDPQFPHQIISHRHFKTILDLKGYDVTYREYRGGHEMLSWRGGIAEGLKEVFHP